MGEFRSSLMEIKEKKEIGVCAKEEKASFPPWY